MKKDTAYNAAIAIMVLVCVALTVVNVQIDAALRRSQQRETDTYQELVDVRAEHVEETLRR